MRSKRGRTYTQSECERACMQSETQISRVHAERPAPHVHASRRGRGDAYLKECRPQRASAVHVARAGVSLRLEKQLRHRRIRICRRLERRPVAAREQRHGTHKAGGLIEL